MSLVRRAPRAIGTMAAISGVTLLLSLLTERPSLAATADNVYVNTNVNQRAGPGTDYPVITIVPNRARVTVHGCLTDFSWCDVGYRGNRGWVFGKYLWAYDQARYFAIREYAPRADLVSVSFELNRYWDAFYRSRPFYADRSRWVARRPGGPINVGVFYDRLSPYGDWVSLRGQYVWVPADVDARWRPYTAGHWAYTDRYGWLWVSAEPFGWATYHYGRWGFSKQVGWFWVPGTRWAPAWVAWRASGDYLAWAPLPPASDTSLDINISFETVPHYYWQVVPTASFLSADLSLEVIRDDAEFLPVLQQTEPVGNVTIVNNVVVNNVVNVQLIEQKTNVKVVVHNVVSTADPDRSGTVEKGAVEVFVPPPVEAAAVAATPPEVKEVEEVAAKSETKEQAGGEPATEELVAAPPAEPSTAAEAPETETPPPADEQPAQPVDEAASPAETPGTEAPAAAAPATEQSGEEPAPPTEPPPPPEEEPSAAAPESAAPTEPPPAPDGEAAPPAGEAPTEPPPPPTEEPAVIAPESAAPSELAPADEAPAVEPEADVPAEPSPPPADGEAPPPAEEAPPAATPPDEPPAADPEPPVAVEPSSPPAEETAPPADAAPAEPPPEDQPAPEPLAPVESPPPAVEEEGAAPAAEAPAETLEQPAPESAPPPATEDAPPCPEGSVRQEGGTCVVPQ